MIAWARAGSRPRHLRLAGHDACTPGEWLDDDRVHVGAVDDGDARSLRLAARVEVDVGHAPRERLALVLAPDVAERRAAGQVALARQAIRELREPRTREQLALVGIPLVREPVLQRPFVLVPASADRQLARRVGAIPGALRPPRR